MGSKRVIDVDILGAHMARFMRQEDSEPLAKGAKVIASRAVDAHDIRVAKPTR